MISKNKSKRGDLANRKGSETKNKKIIDLGNELTLIYLIYLDHVEFRNCNSLTMRPCVREIVGWKAGENSEAICICSDKPAKPIGNLPTKESGHLILKSDILALLIIPFANCFIYNSQCVLEDINS